ncbi:MAG TPA: hypothetical protein VIL69_16915, partial [Roseomonas sp.]
FSNNAVTGWKADAEAAVLPHLPPNKAAIQVEIDNLVLAAADERADALGEILNQDIDFIGEFVELLGASPHGHPHTFRLLFAASLIGQFAAMHCKNVHNTPRPSRLCPALLPPIPVPGHPAFPSGHATQAYLIAELAAHVLPASLAPLGDVLRERAKRIARNREIAGLHFESDSKAGRALALAIASILQNAAKMPVFAHATAGTVAGAKAEWA